MSGSAHRALRGLRGEAGFSLIEAVLAMVLFLIVATAVATVLTSSISSHRLARERTIAQEQAMEKMEEIRRLDYDDVGLISGNPPGTVVAVESINVRGLKATLTVQISYVNDPTAYSYATSANYKRITVTVTRDSDGKQLAREVTYAAPPARAPYGGIGFAIVNAQVVDFALNTPQSGVTVGLATGPSAPRSDSTDSTGTVTFAALDPNPVSGPTAYYDLNVTLPSGYVMLADDVPPGTAAHTQLSPGQTFSTALRIYKPATIDVAVERSDGSAYGGNATITVSSSRGSQVFSYSGTTLTITSINGELVVPGLEYTVSATTAGGLVPTPVTQYVPDDYPSDLSSSFTLSLPPAGTLAVTVMQGGSPASGATVTLTGGPASISLNGTTSGSGVVIFSDVPAGAGYTVTATKGGQNASLTNQTVNTGGTTNITLTLPTPTGTLNATVTWGGAAAPGATVTLSGGPQSINISGTTNGSGVVTFINVPAGSGYTVTAVKSGQSATATNQTVTDGGTTNVALALPTGTLRATVTWAGVALPGATVTLTGGPNSVNLSLSTNSSGIATFSNVPTGSGYTVNASKSGQSAPPATNQTVNTGSTTNVALALPTGTLVATVTWAGVAASGATVTLTGGPQSINVNGTSNSSGVVTFINVPAGTGYTVNASKSGQSAPPATNQSVTGGGTTNVSLALPTATLIVRAERSNGNVVPDATVVVTLGPMSINITGTTNSSGLATFNNVPVGSGYTIKAWHCGITGTASTNKSRTRTGQTLASGGSTIVMPFNSSTCPPP